MYVIIQVGISSFSAKWLKWTNLNFSIVYTLAMLLHQANHLIAGEGIDYHFFLDIMHHILGFWAVIYSCKWLKQ